MFLLVGVAIVVVLSCSFVFFFGIFNDLNVVLSYKTQIQLPSMTRGIKGLFVYLLHLFTDLFVTK